MSYILDAIKKSEAERGHGSIPGLQTVHSSSLNYKTENRQLWPYIIIVLLLINTAGLVFYFLDDKQATITTSNTDPIATTVTAAPPTTTHAVTTIVKPEESIQAPAIQMKEETTPFDAPRNESLTTDNTAQSASNPVITPYREIVPVDEIPAYLKQRIPTMDFTGHVYSSNPLQRSIIINGSFMEEGDAINHELTLSEITSKGAVFNIEDTFFSISIISGWKINQ